MCSVDRDGAILEEGRGTAVNDSSAGMRLLLGIAPPKGQLLEIQTGHSTLGRTVCLVEVCWTKPLREDAQGTLYLVGCRQDFGPRTVRPFSRDVPSAWHPSVNRHLPCLVSLSPIFPR